VDKLKFEVEVLKEDVRQEQVFIQEHKYVAYSGIKPMIDDKCGKLDAEITQATPMITLSELHEAFRDDVAVPFESIKTQRKAGAAPRRVLAPPVGGLLRGHEGLHGGVRVREVREDHAAVRRAHESQVLAEDAGEVVDQMRAMAREAQVMLDFLACTSPRAAVIIRPQARWSSSTASRRRRGTS